MKKRRKRPAETGNRTVSPPAESPALPRFRGCKLWCFRFAALVGAPVFFVLFLEAGLRLAGYGYATEFLLKREHAGQNVLVQNNQFGWRFFGPELARLPHPFCIARTPDPERIRIFVLGESAAKGDPDPHFGLSRTLEAMLSLRHPAQQFEVVNAAMTAINSHAILPIARSCATAEADVWVIYMGNNEVVGPFGAGTIFGSQTPPLSLGRGSLALKTTRTGQLLDSLLERSGKQPGKDREWGGMEMFLEQQVRADDPRMNGVYRHFERNLADIMAVGRRNGVGLVVSTVAVNLRDCAPFGSAHAANLAAAERSRWDALYQAGIAAQNTGDNRLAAAKFSAAAELDNGFAELRYRQGQCALALGEWPEAERHFRGARDLDTLRFRCDTRLNQTIRDLATNREHQRIRLADPEQALAKQSVDGLPGDNFFYEHVHLNFEGNWWVARTIAEHVEILLADRLGPRESFPPWPSVADCARRLGWSDWSQLTGWKGVLPRLHRPPFTGQFDHAARLRRVEATLAEYSSATSPLGISNALHICEAAMDKAPNDWALWSQLAALRSAAGDVPGAVTAARRVVELMPGDAEGWSKLGRLLAGQRHFNDAIGALDQAIQLNPQDVVAAEGKAQCLAALGRGEESLAVFQQLLARQPRLGVAWLHYGQVLEGMGRREQAARAFTNALAHPGRNMAGLVELAGFCQGRGWHQRAAELYAAALQSEPANAKLHVGVAQNLAALGKNGEALAPAMEAVRLAPEFAEARVLLGVLQGRRGLNREAQAEFRAALGLDPRLVDARVNLGLALLRESPAEALRQFEAVLEISPTNKLALKYVSSLRSRGAEGTEVERAVKEP